MVELEFVSMTIEQHLEFATELHGNSAKAKEWIKRVLNNADIIFPWIALDELIPVGYTFIKDNYEDGLAEIHIAVPRKWRTKGYGKRMVYTALRHPEIQRRFRVIWTYIDKDNIASIKCFLDNGFVVKREEDNYLVVYAKIDQRE